MKNDEVQSSVETLSVLGRLRSEGALTESEFDGLKRRLMDDREHQIPLTNAAKPADNTTVSGFVVMLVVLVGLIVADHLQGAIFPDDVYCMVGAGNSHVVPGRTEATSWSANNGCGAGRPECATRWAAYPASSRCVHGTLWQAIQSKIKSL